MTDENNPPAPNPQAKRSPWFWIGVFFGSGLLPVAPGTVGTIASLFLWLPLLYLKTPSWLLILLVVIVTVVGTIAAEKTATLLGKEDPKEVVIDEVAGQGIALLFCPLGWHWFLVSFILFRLFDILKPWPVGWADQKLHGGIGIMADDLIAGVFALGLLQGAAWMILS